MASDEVLVTDVTGSYLLLTAQVASLHVIK